MNKELLFKLYEIHSPSGKEKKMRRFVKKYISRNCGNVKIMQDYKGNVYCVKGESETYPCLAAHLDQVQRIHSYDFTVCESNGVVFGFSPRNRQQEGLGADDKNGIYICLECLKKYDNIKVVFFVEEETGCNGSEYADMAFFGDCRFVIQPDRMGHNDLITSMFCGDVCSDEFIADIQAKDFGYEEERGSITDVGTLIENGVGISCLNLSCGYFEPHTDNEITILADLDNCHRFVERIIETCTKVYPFESYYSYGNYHYERYGINRSTMCNPTNNNGYQHPAYDVNRLKSIMEKDLYEYDYFDNDYEEDKNMMDMLIESQPDLTFDEVMYEWNQNFITRDEDILHDLYEDAVNKYNAEHEYMDRTYDDGDFFGEDTFEYYNKSFEPAKQKVS